MLEGLPTLSELQDAGRFTNTLGFRTLEGLPTLWASGPWKVYQHSELQDAGRFTNTLSFRTLEGLPTLSELQDAGRFTNTL